MVWHWVSLTMFLGTLGCIVLGVLLASLSFLSDCGLCSVTSPSSLGILFASLVTMPHADLLSLRPWTSQRCLCGKCAHVPRHCS